LARRRRGALFAGCAFFGYHFLCCRARLEQIANLIAETGLWDVLGAYAEVRFAAAFTTLIPGWASSVLAERPGRQAGLTRLAGQPETGQRHCGDAEAEPFEGLPPRYRLRHTFGQLIEFVVHSFSSF